MNQIDEIAMIYNSQKENLILTEYGRNFQKMVNHCKTIEDKKIRQAFAERLVRLMLQMQPGNKNTNEFLSKMWNQLMMVAKYELDVDPPEGIEIRTRQDRLNPDRLAYPSDDKPFRHYGNQVLSLIDRAVEMEEGHKKRTFINVIGSYMKLAYKTWNREYYVNDETIKADLKRISGGRLEVPDDMTLDFLNFANIPNPNQHKRRSSGRSGGKDHRNKNKRRRKK